MGVASSSNVAQAVSNVSNFVSQSTTADSTQVNQVSEKVDFKDCIVKLTGNLDVTEAAKINVSNSQIVAAKQDSNLLNNIQQQMLQQAQSQVGFLGIGYADASNSASELVNDTNSVVQSMTTAAAQFSNTNQEFDCDRSFISAGNLIINLGSDANFISQQTLNQQQTTQIVNDVSQSIKQKASATVQGISGLLLLLVLIIGIIVYAVMKPLTSGGAKIGIAVALCIVIAGILVWMYLKSCPPFFSKPNQCVNNSSVGGCTDGCIDMKPQELYLKNPPLRYIYGLYKGDQSLPGGNLVQMLISAYGNTNDSQGNNGGYTAKTMNDIDSKLSYYQSYAESLGIPNIPNPLTVSYDLPPPNKSPYWEIPEQFMIGGQASCTPQIVQVYANSPGIITGCKFGSTSDGFMVDPNNQGLSGTSIDSLGIANFNSEGWDSYLAQDDSKNTRAKFARFVLCDMIGNIDMNVYLQDDEYIKYNDDNNNPVIIQASGAPSHCYQFRPQGTNISWRDGLSGSGYIAGQMGVCNDRTYKFQKFMRNIGIYILLGLVIIAFMWMGYTWFKNRKTTPVQTEIELTELGKKK